MSKILVGVYLPQTGREYQFWIPSGAPVWQVNRQVNAAFLKMRDIPFIPSRDTVLCRSEDGKIIAPNLLIAEAGIKNGSRLLLI